MNRAMLTASVTMGQLQKKIDTIGHNLANTDTVGYKKRETNFNDLLYKQINNQANENEEIGRRTPNGIRQGSGAKLSETNLRMEQGSLKVTDRPLDIALTRPTDFFELLVEENGDFATRYTRDGSFYLSPYGDGEMALVTADGDFVMGTEGEPIFVPEDFKDLKFTETGEIVVTYDDHTEESLGQLQLVQILRPQLLQAAGANQFALPDLEQMNLLEEEVFQVASGEAGLIQQGALEMSNVDMATEMTELMTTQRSYQFNAKSISIADQMAGLIGNMR